MEHCYGAIFGFHEPEFWLLRHDDSLLSWQSAVTIVIAKGAQGHRKGTEMLEPKSEIFNWKCNEGRSELVQGRIAHHCHTRECVTISSLLGFLE